MPWLQSENNTQKRKLSKYGFKLKQVDLELSFFGRNWFFKDYGITLTYNKYVKYFTKILKIFTIVIYLIYEVISY